MRTVLVVTTEDEHEQIKAFAGLHDLDRLRFFESEAQLHVDPLPLLLFYGNWWENPLVQSGFFTEYLNTMLCQEDLYRSARLASNLRIVKK